MMFRKDAYHMAIIFKIKNKQQCILHNITLLHNILIKYKLQIKKPTRLLRGNCCRMIEQTFFPEGPLRMATAEGDGSKQIQN